MYCIWSSYPYEIWMVVLINSELTSGLWILFIQKNTWFAVTLTVSLLFLTLFFKTTWLKWWNFSSLTFFGLKNVNFKIYEKTIMWPQSSGKKCRKCSSYPRSATAHVNWETKCMVMISLKPSTKRYKLRGP